MIRETSDAVNEAVAALREQVKQLRAKQTGRGLDPYEATQLMELCDRLFHVENNRAQVLVAFIAGRRGLDKLPAAELEQVVKGIAELGPKETE